MKKVRMAEGRRRFEDDVFILATTATDERRITFCHVYTALLDYFKVWCTDHGPQDADCLG